MGLIGKSIEEDHRRQSRTHALACEIPDSSEVKIAAQVNERQAIEDKRGGPGFQEGLHVVHTGRSGWSE
jgi:hypothetical protein